jgi:glyoxylase-like metal-dependent hydrolase (beta-lactamase superfamily II)
MARPVLELSETAIEQVKGLGYQPKDVRHILPTHLHLDHIGGISDFPTAKIHIFQKEYEAAMRPSSDYLPYQWAHQPDWELYEEQGDKWFGFDSVRPLIGDTDDVLLIPLPGHTAGHTAIAIKQENGWLLHCGDSYYYHKEIKSESPFVPLGLRIMGAAVNFDKTVFKKNQERLRELFRTQQATVQLFCAHDVEEFKAF